MRLLYFISIYLHILSAMIWLGGMLFLVLIIAPMLRHPNYQQVAGRILEEAGERFRFWGWICLTTFFLTGLYNASYRLGGFSYLFNQEAWQGIWLQTLGVKLALFAVIVILSAIHDFKIGPLATRMMEQAPDDPATLRLRKQASWIGRINLLLALVIVYIAISLVRGMP